MPTFKEMRSRSTGHAAVLRKIAAHEAILTHAATPGQIRGMQQLLSTLSRWGLTEMVYVGMAADTPYSSVYPKHRRQITDLGRQWLRWLEEG